MLKTTVIATTILLANAGSMLKAMEQEPTPEILAAATVYKGEGIEHALGRQLFSNPEKFKNADPKRCYAFKGDIKNYEAVAIWAGNTAHCIGIKIGVIDTRFGAELRIAQPNTVAYVLDLDSAGNFKVIEYQLSAKKKAATSTSIATTTGSQAKPVTSKATLASTTGWQLTVTLGKAATQFLGNPDYVRIHPLRPYLYLYVAG